MRTKNSGFSLLELMVVMVILGLLASMLVLNLGDQPDEARVTKAQVDISQLGTALDHFKLDNGFYPSTEQGLAALIKMPETGQKAKNYRKGGYLKANSVPQDPWGNEYIYRCPGDEDRDYDIMSFGADGEEGGDGKDQDITSWEM